MFYVYAISSINRTYIYVGLTDNPARRISEHNLGYNRTTKPYAPFLKLIEEKFNTRAQAREREKYLKSGIGKDFLRNIKSKLKENQDSM
jgi:putative endonuclease